MSTQSEAFVFAADAPLEPAGEGIVRQILGFGDTIMVVRVTFEEGAIGYVHAHPHAQSSYVESGEFEVSIDGEVRLLTAGDAFYVSPNLAHGAVCKGAGVLIDVFSPMREDFLESEPAA